MPLFRPSLPFPSLLLPCRRPGPNTHHTYRPIVIQYKTSLIPPPNYLLSAIAGWLLAISAGNSRGSSRKREQIASPVSQWSTKKTRPRPTKPSQPRVRGASYGANLEVTSHPSTVAADSARLRRSNAAASQPPPPPSPPPVLSPLNAESPSPSASMSRRSPRGSLPPSAMALTGPTAGEGLRDSSVSFRCSCPIKTSCVWCTFHETSVREGGGIVVNKIQHGISRNKRWGD